MKTFAPLAVALLAVTLQAEPRANAEASAGKFVTSADCRGWFTTWAASTKASLEEETKAAQGLKLDARTAADVAAPLDAILKGANQLCARLDSQKVKPANPGIATTPAQVCTDAFSKWDDEADQAYAVAVFAKKVPDEDKQFVPAQDVAHREAKLAKAYCQMLERLH